MDRIVHHSPRRFRRNVALGVVFVSVLGAMVAWRASVWSGRAGGFDQQALSDSIDQQHDRAVVRSQLQADERLVATYGEHLSAARTLKRTSQAPGLDGAARAPLAAAVQDERSLANTDRRFFLLGYPVRDAADRVTLNTSSARDQLAESNSRLRPKEQSSLARRAHVHAVRLTFVSTLFVAALVFFTLAQVTRRSVRHVFAWSGAGTALIALVLFIAV
jgi:hypothetical protein